MSALYPDVATMLRAHGIDAAEQPFPVRDAYSGAMFSAAMRDDERFIIKRIDAEQDWLMAQTRDVTCREAEFAVSSVPAHLPPCIGVATLGASIDGAGRALLMRDVSADLLLGFEAVDAGVMAGVLECIALLHARFWDAPPAREPVSWCALDTRITILSPAVGELLAERGHDFGLARGWQAFGAMHPELWQRLRRLLLRPAGVCSRLARVPQTLLHGDLKLANMAWREGNLTLLDWALVGLGPVAVDVAWVLSVNSGRLPWTLDETLARYGSALRAALGEDRWATAAWETQLHLVALVGLMLYGWGKALDFERDGSPELGWWCERGAKALDALAL